LAASGRIAAYIYGHIVYSTRYQPHQFSLRLNVLKVKAVQNSLPGLGVIILHKRYIRDLLPKPAVSERFHKKSAIVAKNTWLQELHIVDLSVKNLRKTLTLIFSIP